MAATVTGNITGSNLLTGGLISATGTITGTSFLGTVTSVTANITGGNILTAGLASVTGNVNIGNAAGVTWANATGVRVWTYYNNAAGSLDTVFL